VQDKIQAINKWPQPHTIPHIHQFLGLAGYYQRFIKGFSQIASPLSNLLKVGEAANKAKNHLISWNTTCQLSFDRIKATLVSVPVLQQVDWLKPFIIETEASDLTIGSCLLEQAEDGKLHSSHTRAESSATLRSDILSTKRNSLPSNKQCLAGTDTVTTACITILTDHESVKYMNMIKHPSARLTRWIDEFQMYNLDIRYRPGVKAIVPDARSGCPDYLTAITERELQGQIEYVEHMGKYLTDGTLPEDEFD
jgi:hypothetical protein